MWIARDKNGELYLYSDKPIKHEKYGFFREKYEAEEIFIHHEDSGIYGFIQLDGNLFPEVTWENSPKELIIKM